MSNQIKLPLNTWLVATWHEYIHAVEQPAYANGKSYYHNGNVKNVQIIAFAIVDSGSRRITRSQVLPGLTVSLLEAALRSTRQMNQAQVGAWLLTQMQAQNI